MKPEPWHEIHKLLDAVLELAPDARPAFLAKACASDPDLLKEVESLLAAHEHAGSTFLEEPAVPVVALRPGAKLGTYAIVKMVGAGGMGEVYRARDTVLGRELAIKILPPIFSRDADRLHRFEQEARAAAAPNHPNILSIHQLGTHAGAPYLVSEFLEGETLRSRLERGGLPASTAVDYTLQLVNGLAAAHERGIVHRDLKPENVFLASNGLVKILDFGLAKLSRPEEFGSPEAMTQGSGTVPGIVMGTIGYMSPEQVRGLQVDHRSDIFALGAILFEMLSARRAFQGNTPVDTLTAILMHDPPSLTGTNPNVTPPLDRTIRRCLEKDPKERFQSAKEVGFALKALSDALGSVRADSDQATGVALSRRMATKRALSLAALAFVAVLGLLVAANVGGVRSLLWSRGQIQSLAVLPLANLSGDPAQDYFADGMTEAMITELAQISALRVISRTSVMQYKVARNRCRRLPASCVWIALLKARCCAREKKCESRRNGSRQYPNGTCGPRATMVICAT